MKNGVLNNKLFFNKYKIKKLIYQTKLSSIYEGINIKENEPVAIKLEKKSGKFDLLESEAYFLFYLKGYGIPKIISFGTSGLYKVLVEELLGLSINSLWEMKKRYKTGSKLLIKDVCMIALQGLERLEYIHSKNIIHRDIKPHNFVSGKNNPELIYLIDFGFARKYRSSRTGKHIKYKWLKYAYGSLRYYSLNANRGYELSRRDDLESFGYMLVYLARQYLPWISTEELDIDKNIKIEAIFKLKNSATPETLCKDLPEEFAEFVRYTRNLEFEEDPKYDYLKSLFTNILIKNQQKIDFNFFWITKKKKEKIERKNEEDKSKGKRKNSKSRLFNRIKHSLEKANSQKIIPVLKLKKKETTQSVNKPNENKSEIKIEDNCKSYDINKKKENINNLNLFEMLENNNNYKIIDLNQNDKYKKINTNIFRNNDNCEEYGINLKNSIDNKNYINDDKNRTGLFNKRIIINPSKEAKLSGKLCRKIYKSPISICIKKRNELRKIKNMEYKTIKERHNLDDFNNLYDKSGNDFNYNNFNNIMFKSLGDKSINSIRNYGNNDEKNSRTVAEKYNYQSHHGNDINYFNLNCYNKPRDKPFLIINNNTNYNQIKSFLIINNNKRNGSISPNTCFNRSNLLKRQKKNNNIDDYNSYMNIHQYY